MPSIWIEWTSNKFKLLQTENNFSFIFSSTYCFVLFAIYINITILNVIPFEMNLSICTTWRSFNVVRTKITKSKFIILCRHCHFRSPFSFFAAQPTNGDWVQIKVKSCLIYVHWNAVRWQFHHQCRFIYCNFANPTIYTLKKHLFNTLFYYDHLTNKNSNRNILNLNFAMNLLCHSWYILQPFLGRKSTQNLL